LQNLQSIIVVICKFIFTTTAGTDTPTPLFPLLHICASVEQHAGIN
jgi:hypothetical protein